MTPHCKIYFKYFKLTESDFIECEQCGNHAVDLHHVNGRGKGMDVIENIMALCRGCHEMAHSSPNQYISKSVMQSIHDEFLKKHAVQHTK